VISPKWSPLLWPLVATVARRYYRMVTVVTCEDVMSQKTVATEGHNSDGQFSDITEEPL
jgi:hypothetical protein